MESIWSHVCKKCWSRDVIIANWYENKKNRMKIANPCENCKCPHRKNTPKGDNCKPIWKLQTDMKIRNCYENCKAILIFWSVVPTRTFAIFIWETQRDWKLVLEKNFLVGLCHGWKKFLWQDSLIYILRDDSSKARKCQE